MAVLIIADIHGQTAEGYDGMLAALAEPLARAPGLLMHAAQPTEDGWRVIEVWQSKALGDQFYAQQVAPNLPPGIRPKRSVVSLHCVLTPAGIHAN